MQNIIDLTINKVWHTDEIMIFSVQLYIGNW